MPTYSVTVDGKEYEFDAPEDKAAQAAEEIGQTIRKGFSQSGVTAEGEAFSSFKRGAVAPNQQPQAHPVPYSSDMGAISDEFSGGTGSVRDMLPDFIFGRSRETELTRTSPDYRGSNGLPEMRSAFSIPALKAAYGTLSTGPEETVQILKTQFPDIGVRQDEKGNYILTSPTDGKDYAIQPGFRASDLLRGIAVGGKFAATQALLPGSGIIPRVIKAGITETQSQAEQSKLGGRFDAANIPETMAAEAGMIGAGKIAGKGYQAAKDVLGFGSRELTPAQKLIQSAKSVGVEPMTSEVFPPQTPTANTLQAVRENTFLGTGERLREQAQRRVDIVKDLMREHGALAPDSAIDDVSRNLSQTRKSEISRLVNAKRDVIEGLSTPEIPIDLSRTKAALRNGISELEKSGATTNSAAIAKLEGLLSDVSKLDELKYVEQFRKALGEAFTDSNLASVKTAGEQAINKVYGPLKQDMGEYIFKNGGEKDYAKWLNTEKKLKAGVDELKSGLFKRVLQKGEISPEEVGKLLFSQKPSEVKLLMTNLSPEGKLAAKVALLRKAFEKAGGDRIGSDVKETLSPTRFANEIERLAKPIGVAFNSEEKERINGLVKVLNASRRAGEFAANPPTGNKLFGIKNFEVITGLLSTWFGLPAVASVAAGTIGIGGLSRAYESKAVRNILVQIARIPENDPQFVKLLGNLANALQATRELNQSEK